MPKVRKTARRRRPGRPPQHTCHGSLIRLLPDFEERYVILHKHTFPGVLRRIRRCHIRNYSIFLREGILFSHFEYIGRDYDTDMAAMGDAVTQEWWKLTAPMQEPLPTRKSAEWWASMELLLRTEIGGAPSRSVRRSAYVAQVTEGAEAALRAALPPHGAQAVRGLKTSGVRTLTIYLKDARVYAYVEWTPKTSPPDDLSGVSPLRQWLGAIEGHVVNDGTVWKPMQEVFHTD